MMSPFDMVAFIVLVSVVGGLLRSWLKSRAGSGPAGMTAEQAARLARLEERIKALESVVGDASYELKQKFKELER
jgi:hypothetical protein